MSQSAALGDTAIGGGLRFVSVVPTRVGDPATASSLLRSEGAVILTGVEPTPEGGVSAARSILGDAVLDIRPQILASKAFNDDRLRRRDSLDELELRRSKRRHDHTVALPPHNDGFALGDEAPDYLFLNCVESCPAGGESWLLDGLALLGALTDAEGAAGLWDTDLDHTDPGYDRVVGPIARRVGGRRVQVRMNPYQQAVADDPASLALAATWSAAKEQAADDAERFRLERGDLLCVDNLRLAHSRDAFLSEDRLLVSTWAWTVDALAVPVRPLDLL